MTQRCKHSKDGFCTQLVIPERCDGIDSGVGCTDFEIDFDKIKQASKEAEKPVLTLTKSQIRRIFRKLKQHSISTCSCGRKAEEATLNIVEWKLYEKGGFI